MPWNDPDSVLVAGSGEAYVGPVGTAEPATSAASLNAALAGLGYHTEDGVTVNKSLEIVRHRAWQSRSDIRRDKESETFQIAFALLQWDENTLPFALGGGAITTVGSGEYKYTPPSDDSALEEKMLVADVIDGSTRGRFVIPRGNIVEGIEAQFQRTEMATLSVTFEALDNPDGLDWYFLTNSDAFAAGS